MPEGYSEGVYNGVTYSVTKTTYNHGRSFKVFARELGGKDIISLNYYLTSKKEILKPCEMSEQKVIDFLENVKIK